MTFFTDAELGDAPDSREHLKPPKGAQRRDRVVDPADAVEQRRRRVDAWARRAGIPADDVALAQMRKRAAHTARIDAELEDARFHVEHETLRRELAGEKLDGPPRPPKREGTRDLSDVDAERKKLTKRGRRERQGASP